MLDISKKSSTLRTATAEATLKLNTHTLERVRCGDTPKGVALEVARVAGILAAKNTSQIIPFCHPLPLDHVEISFDTDDSAIVVTATVKATYKTGVEMEALTAVTVAALTLYDMLKMLDDSMEITGIKVLEKHGGKSDYHSQYETPLRAAVLVMSDSVASGKKDDLSGRLIAERLKAEAFDVVDYKIIPDDRKMIIETLRQYADNQKLDLILTCGGTGFGPRDTTPEAMTEVVEREIPGIPETLRAYGQTRTPFSMLSR
jgi:cyclic pyranopterin phosphate synthase